jgi:hypothetical protein
MSLSVAPDWVPTPVEWIVYRTVMQCKDAVATAAPATLGTCSIGLTQMFDTWLFLY